MPDMHRISKKFHRGGASLQEVVRVYQAIEKVGYLNARRPTADL
jgi:DNA mismatch repair protein MSH2